MGGSLEIRPATKIFRSVFLVLFNMHDTDNDGVITLEEYRKVRKDNQPLLLCAFLHCDVLLVILTN